MRKAVINLDWLEGEIEKLRGGILSGTYHKYIGTAKVDSADMAMTLELVVSKCTPIEEPQLGTIKENGCSTGFIGIREPLYKLVEQDPNEGMFFPKNEKVTFTTKVDSADIAIVLSKCTPISPPTTENDPR